MNKAWNRTVRGLPTFQVNSTSTVRKRSGVGTSLEPVEQTANDALAEDELDHFGVGVGQDGGVFGDRGQRIAEGEGAAEANGDFDVLGEGQLVGGEMKGAVEVVGDVPPLRAIACSAESRCWKLKRTGTVTGSDPFAGIAASGLAWSSTTWTPPRASLYCAALTGQFKRVGVLDPDVEVRSQPLRGDVLQPRCPERRGRFLDVERRLEGRATGG